jgi:biotin carboxylase
MYVNARDKAFIRDCSKDIEGLSSTKYVMFDGLYPKSYPCVVKPTVGGGKKGVNFVRNKADFDRLVENNLIDEHYMIEEFIDGREFSIESISYKGNHYVIQITDKDSLGYPHFVEIGHHQPSTLPDEVKDRIKKVVPQLLTACNYQNGPTHIEMKLTQSGELHLIEINLRGGGDEISSQLVQLSTGYDYVKAMIDVALDRFEVPEVRDFAHSGIYFLCNQTKQYLNFFKSADKQLWLVDKNIKSYDLIESTSNWDRNGYIIYRSDHKILPK